MVKEVVDLGKVEEKEMGMKFSWEWMKDLMEGVCERF